MGERGQGKSGQVGTMKDLPGVQFRESKPRLRWRTAPSAFASGRAKAAVPTQTLRVANAIPALQARLESANMLCLKILFARVWYPLPCFFSQATTSASSRMETACFTGR